MNLHDAEQNLRDNGLDPDAIRDAFAPQTFSTADREQHAMTEQSEPLTVSGNEVLAAIAAATDEPAYIEQTGGGTATVLIGTPRYINDEMQERHRLAFGPGSFYPSPSFYLQDLTVGPDDWGERPGIEVTSLAGLTEAVRELLSRPDWREDAR